MPPGITCARAVWADPPICTGNWKVWQYCVPADADRGQAGLVDLGTGPAVADQVDGRSRWRREVVSPWCRTTPRITVIVVVLVGSPLIWTRSTLPVALSTSSSTSWFIRNVASAERQAGLVGAGRPRRRAWSTAVPVLVGVHQEVDALDRHVRQPGHERVAVGEPVADRDGDVVPRFDTGLLGAEEPLKKIGRHGKVISVQRSRISGGCVARPECPRGACHS